MILPRTSNDGWLAAATTRPVFALFWTSGPDPTLDGVLRALARRRAPDGTWEDFERWCDPGANGAREFAGQDRWKARFGRGAPELAGCADPAVLWAELREFLGDGLVLVPESETFRDWCAHLAGEDPGLGTVLGLGELAAVLHPGRLAQRRGELLGAIVEPTAGAGSEAYAPSDVALAFDELARRFLEREEDVLRVAVQGYRRAWHGLAAQDPRAARELNTVLSLVDRRSGWSPAESAARFDGRLAALVEPELPLEDLLESSAPRAARDLARWELLPELAVHGDEVAPFHAEDAQLLDQLFERHLPALFAGAQGQPNYRRSQHAVARAVAGAFGRKELLLVHAPTGTGKTLAYLVPALLWARRHDVRVGIATYTRALQEQAMDREVPRALAALARAGVPAGTRVSVLKGRENYLCWRALKLTLPDEDDEAATWLAWTSLLLFALTDLEGDLDRLPLAPPVTMQARGPYVAALTALARSARAQSACCTQREDRESCAAEAARARAQRSHVVIVNQAFALARREFFRHIVFDECEHLHDQAHSAFSHVVSFRDMRSALARLSRTPRERSRAVLDLVERMVLEGTPSHGCTTRAVEGWTQASVALAQLERATTDFERWRVTAAQAREDRDQHSLLREYADGEGRAQLVEARTRFVGTWSELQARLAELAERLDALPLRGIKRLRRTLDQVRADLDEVLDAVEAWLPLEEGQPAFRPRTFYDVERDAHGNLVLASRVLLPNEFLGRSYYPDLLTGVFLSATTVLQDGFEAAQAYLGLDRAAQPDADEDRPPCVVRTFRAPEVFDYSRVLVAVPRDVPPAQGDKQRFLDYVRRFVGHLAERTRGRTLVLFTNANDTLQVGQELAGFFRARSIPFWFQNMEGRVKEELGELFRARVDSVLMGVDTFWYGADFPGETLEYLVIVKLPYGVPDRYHHAQCAALGLAEQRRRIYLPRALAKFRQGFGRLMRRESDRGCVFVLDGRVLDPKHRMFLRELPIERAYDAAPAPSAPGAPGGRARFVRAETERCLREALAHMGIAEDVRRRGLDWSFPSDARVEAQAAQVAGSDGPPPADGFETPPVRPEPRRAAPPRLDISSDELPF